MWSESHVIGLDDLNFAFFSSSFNRHLSKHLKSSNSHLHMSAKACCLWTCVLWLANCCCWCAKVCFMRTIRMLCSIAYFLALLTVSNCSVVSRGKVPPKMPNTLVAGPKATSPTCLMVYMGCLMNSFSRFEGASKMEGQKSLINVEVHSIYLNFLMSERFSNLVILFFLSW